MADVKSGPRWLGPEDWAEAALEALAEGGLRAVAVERIAARIGATKGSFYWHFSSRDELITAAVERWHARTEEAIAVLGTIADPVKRLRTLVEHALSESPAARVDRALIAASEDPRVSPVLRDVTERRIRFITGIYREMGLPSAEAGSRALLGYAAYVGLLALRPLDSIDIEARLDGLIESVLRA